MLNEMRLGHISTETVKTFRAMARPLQAKDGIEVTELWVLLFCESTLLVADNPTGSQRETKSSSPTREGSENFLARSRDTTP